MHSNMRIVAFLLCAVLFEGICPAVSEISDSDTYVKLPNLFEYDDFDECRKGNPKFQYCVVQAVIHPTSDSQIWRNISILSADHRNFPHDHLERGICIRSCLNRIAAIQPMDVCSIESRLMGKQDLIQYLDQCLNIELGVSYDLQASSKAVHCLSENDLRVSLSAAELIFIGLVVSLILLVSIATMLDFKGTRTQYDALILHFSIPRNVRTLLDCKSVDGNLSHLEGFRVIYTIIIFLIHSSLPMMRMPLKNVEDLEKQTNSFIFPVVNSLNTHMITFFFTLGGMVLSIGFLNHIDKAKGFSLRYQWEKLLNRLARLLPAYAFVIFYQSTLFKRTQQTPVGFKFLDYCSDHWWSNLLMINNFVHLDEPCLQYGWYLGADFQLFLIGMGIMTLIWRFPVLKKICIGAMLSIALVVPGMVIFLKKLDATMSFDMRHALNQLREYKEFLQYYTPFYTNAGTYFFGMIAGMVYHHIAKNNLKSVAIFYIKMVFRCILILFIIWNGFLAFLPSIKVKKPSMFLSIYGSALKALWGIFHATLFLLYAFKSESILVAFLEHPVLRVLAKLSYTIYIVQYSIIHMVYSNLNVPIRYGVFNTIIVTSANYLLTFCSAIFLYLVIEVPFASILKQVIQGKLRIIILDKKDQKIS